MATHDTALAVNRAPRRKGCQGPLEVVGVSNLTIEASMDDQRWPPGPSVLFAVAASLALWTVLILVLSLALG